MLNNVLNTLNDPKEMTKNFVNVSFSFFVLALGLATFGHAYPAGFAVVGCFTALFAAAINATIISVASGVTSITDGDTSTEAGSIS